MQIHDEQFTPYICSRVRSEFIRVMVSSRFFHFQKPADPIASGPGGWAPIHHRTRRVPKDERHRLTAASKVAS